VTNYLFFIGVIFFYWKKTIGKDKYKKFLNGVKALLNKVKNLYTKKFIGFKKRISNFRFKSKIENSNNLSKK
jgi:hypothetical protein